GAEIAGTDKPFVVTTGALALAHLGRLGTELDEGASDLPRIAAEYATLGLANRGVRSSIIRLAPSVHSDQDKHGFVSTLTAIARAKGKSAYVGDGSNRWPAVHQLDAAKLYRLALESAPAGSRLHGVGEEGIPFREIAEAIGRNLNLPAESITVEESKEHFGFLAMFIVMDAPTSSDITQKLLNWKIEGPGLIEDIDSGHYFKS
ncbi:MAG TPA: 3-beta hydroxysteroid dehydrogenase, partial [Candidatus Nanopelagicaceae bacterium]